MENVKDGGCTNSNLILNVRKKTIRFKAGADLSSSVNLMDVNVFEDKLFEIDIFCVLIFILDQPYSHTVRDTAGLWTQNIFVGVFQNLCL